MQPLTILDLDDFELLIGLVESGSSAVEILRRKAESSFRKLDLQQWRANDPTAPPERRAAPLDRRMRELFAAVVDQLGLDPEAAG